VNLYRALGNDLLNRLDPLGLADWEMMWEWHHKFPQEFREKFPWFDFDSIENGVMVRAGNHRGAGDSIHAKGWNNEWKKWIEEMERNGREITKEAILEQAEKMMKSDQFKEYFKDCRPATERYDVRRARLQKLREAAEQARRTAEQARTTANNTEGFFKRMCKRVRKGAKLCKAIPVVGAGVTLLFWYEDVQAKGWMGGTANSVLDAIPIFGTVKAGIELFTGDWIPDKNASQDSYNK
jgi:hypothetical protein